MLCEFLRRVISVRMSTDLDCCVRWAMCLGTCGNTSFNKERSYLYVRENSIESNFAMKSKFDCTSCRSDATRYRGSVCLSVQLSESEPACASLLCAFCPDALMSAASESVHTD